MFVSIKVYVLHLVLFLTYTLDEVNEELGMVAKNINILEKSKRSNNSPTSLKQRFFFKRLCYKL